MNTSEWIGRTVAGWLPAGKRQGASKAPTTDNKPESRTTKPAVGKDGRPALAALGLTALADAPRLTLRDRQILGGDAYALWSCAF